MVSPRVLRPARAGRWATARAFVVAAVLGALLWAGRVADAAASAPTDALTGALGADLALGAAGVLLLLRRRRDPLLVAVLTGLAVALSVAALGPALVAAASVAGRRRPGWVVATVAAHVVGHAGAVVVGSSTGRSLPDALAGAGLGLVALLVALTVGSGADTAPATPGSRLRPWSRAWRYAVAAGLGLAAWIANAATRLDGAASPAERAAAEEVLGGELVLGVLAVALLALRRRYPLAVAVVTTALLSVSGAALGAALVAVVSMATWRRRSWVAVTGATVLVTQVGAVLLDHPSRAPAPDAASAVAGIVIVLLMAAAAVATGYYVGARRELEAALRERAESAERAQASSAEAAREAERTRIAREMHDVLAHRISLVALHAGALAYREDLDRRQTAETAETIQTNAQLALTELRQVLGVLRADDRAGDGPDEAAGEAAAAEPPQPTLAELPALLADADEAGTRVSLDTDGVGTRPGGLAAVPTTLSRTAFRVVQEGLTNARKHSPAAAVAVRLAGAPGGDLVVEVRNGAHAGPGLVLPSSGVGLAGLAERAALAGGTLEHGPQPDGSFLLRARLPWQT